MQLSTKLYTSKDEFKKASELEEVILWRIEKGHSKSKSDFVKQCIEACLESSETNPIAFYLPSNEKEDIKKREKETQENSDLELKPLENGIN